MACLNVTAQGLVYVHGEFDFQPPVIRAPESLGQFGRLGQRIAFQVEPNAVPQSVGLDHQGVALPLAGRVPVPGRLRIDRQRTVFTLNVTLQQSLHRRRQTGPPWSASGVSWAPRLSLGRLWLSH